METIEYHDVVDKSSWPDGPWAHEPDKRQWPTHTGMPGLIVRGPSGALCGYVGVGTDHPFHGLDYDQCYDRFEFSPDVHGGLTFYGACQTDQPEDHSVCHIPGPGESDDMWWLGFDCAHSGDETPAFHQYQMATVANRRDKYRTLDYVVNEVEALARQLSDAADRIWGPAT